MMERIERELDITTYIRRQITISNYIKATTTKNARNLTRHSYSFMEPDESEWGSTESQGCSDNY